VRPQGSPISSRPLRGAIPRTAPGPKLCPNVALINTTQHQKSKSFFPMAHERTSRTLFKVVVFASRSFFSLGEKGDWYSSLKFSAFAHFNNKRLSLSERQEPCCAIMRGEWSLSPRVTFKHSVRILINNIYRGLSGTKALNGGLLVGCPLKSPASCVTGPVDPGRLGGPPGGPRPVERLPVHCRGRRL